MSCTEDSFHSVTILRLISICLSYILPFSAGRESSSRNQSSISKMWRRSFKMINGTSSWSVSQRSAGSLSCSTLKIWTVVARRLLPPPLSPPDAPPSDQSYLLGRCPTSSCPPPGQSMTSPDTPWTPTSRPTSGLAVLIAGSLLRDVP